MAKRWRRARALADEAAVSEAEAEGGFEPGGEGIGEEGGGRGELGRVEDAGSEGGEGVWVVEIELGSEARRVSPMTRRGSRWKEKCDAERGRDRAERGLPVAWGRLGGGCARSLRALPLKTRPCAAARHPGAAGRRGAATPLRRGARLEADEQEGADGSGGANRGEGEGAVAALGAVEERGGGRGEGEAGGEADGAAEYEGFGREELVAGVEAIRALGVADRAALPSLVGLVFDPLVGAPAELIAGDDEGDGARAQGGSSAEEGFVLVET